MEFRAARQINTDMHEKVAGIGNTDGYELHRLIYTSVDAIPAKAEFAYDQSLMQIVPLCGGQIKNLKELYELRVLLKKKVSKYNKELLMLCWLIL